MVLRKKSIAPWRFPTPSFANRRDVRAHSGRLELEPLCDVTRRESFRKYGEHVPLSAREMWSELRPDFDRAEARVGCGSPVLGLRPRVFLPGRREHLAAYLDCVPSLEGLEPGLRSLGLRRSYFGHPARRRHCRAWLTPNEKNV